jgi:uncharacterized protein
MRSSMALGALAVSLALAGTGCSRSPQVTFYTLESAATLRPVLPPAAIPGAAANAPGAAANPAALPAVAVGPVTLPEVVDRPQLVVRVAPNRVAILESQRWAEPLRSEIPRVIAEDLGRLLGSSRVASYVQRAGGAAEVQVVLDIERFEAAPGEGVNVEAVWSLKREAGAAVTGRSRVREAATGEGYDPLVAAFGRALLSVSADLAQAIRAQAAGVR